MVDSSSVFRYWDDCTTESNVHPLFRVQLFAGVGIKLVLFNPPKREVMCLWEVSSRSLAEWPLRNCLQSAHATLRAMKILVYMRVKTVRVLMNMHITKVAIQELLRFGGLTRLGFTFGGGARAGPFRSSCIVSGDAISTTITKQKTGERMTGE